MKKKLTEEQKEKIEQDKKDFLDCIENTYMSIEQAINRTMTKNPGEYNKRDIAAWLKREIKNKQLSAQVLVKINEYLEMVKRNSKEKDR